MKIAKWWQKTEDNKILCTLCPRLCTLAGGQEGFCFIRKNIDGVLYTSGYGASMGFAVDPIEKKPLYHFLPGSSILSFGTAGCNLGCKFCQNWSMTKIKFAEANLMKTSIENIINLAQKNNTPSIAFTYNDPTVFGEFVIDVSNVAREHGLKSVLVSAGYISPEARKDVYRYIDAANIDLKSFKDDFYSRLTSSHLSPVLDTLVWMKKETNIWFEITNLIIPDENDSKDELKEMCDWIVANLGENIPIHFSAFFPNYKMTNKPPTPTVSLIMAQKIAVSAGIKYVYIGNTSQGTGQSTFCPACKTKLITRNQFSIVNNLMASDRCNKCNYLISGVF